MNTLKKDKNAVTGVITTILMILLAISAVSIVALFIKQNTDKILLNPEEACINQGLEEFLKIEKACYNNNSKDLELSIKLLPSNIKLTELQFTLSTSNLNKRWKCSDFCDNCKLPEQGKIKTYYFDVSSFNLDINKDRTMAIASSNCLLKEAKITDC